MHYKIKGPNVPVFNDGTEIYRIVTDDGIETTVAEYRYRAADHKSPGFADYMEDQRRIARAMLEMVQASESHAARIVDLQRTLRAKYFPKG